MSPETLQKQFLLFNQAFYLNVKKVFMHSLGVGGMGNYGLNFKKMDELPEIPVRPTEPPGCYRKFR